MVHLNRVSTDLEVKEKRNLVDGVESIELEPFDQEDAYTATVYGSKYVPSTVR